MAELLISLLLIIVQGDPVPCNHIELIIVEGDPVPCNHIERVQESSSSVHVMNNSSGIGFQASENNFESSLNSRKQ